MKGFGVWGLGFGVWGLGPPNQQGADRKRSVLPCPRRFTGLAFNVGERDRWLPDVNPLILATIANPFIGGVSFRPSLDGKSVEILQVERYVRWLARRRSESEAHIAEQLWKFILYVDQLMQDHWRRCERYDLKDGRERSSAHDEVEHSFPQVAGRA